MLAATQQERVPLRLSRFRDRPVLRLTLIGALSAVFALALTGCGRKGPLDPPPGASLAGETQPNMPGLMSEKGRAASIGAELTSDNPGVGPDGQPLAPKGPKKRIPLDNLLN